MNQVSPQNGSMVRRKLKAANLIGKRFLISRVRHRFPRGIVLLYHRVASPKHDPYELAVTPENFAEHMSVLRNSAEAVSVFDICSDEPKSGRVAVTFDDGYEDNLTHAVPILKKFQIPATMFITTAYLGKDHGFWWDQIGSMEPYSGQECCSDELLAVLQSYDPNLSNFPSSHSDLLDAIHHIAGGMKYTECRDFSTKVMACAGVVSSDDSIPDVLTEDQLAELSSEPLIEIGAHTNSHPVMSRLSDTSQSDEIKRSTEKITTITGTPPRLFAFPFGGGSHIGKNSPEIVKSLGFQFAMANWPGQVWRLTNPYLVPRFVVRNWDGETFAKKLAEFINH
jgi:peptidoglycan/xylan/chitin deacetylase (PgdA/CDA1 family)